MGKNSIQNNLTKDDLIAEIRLTLGADFKREHTVIIVEGEDDISFLTESSLQMWTSVSLFRKAWCFGNRQPFLRQQSHWRMRY